jgi:hypothetical protein
MTVQPSSAGSDSLAHPELLTRKTAVDPRLSLAAMCPNIPSA